MCWSLSDLGIDRFRVEQLLLTVGNILDRQKEQFQASFTPSQGPLLALLRERGRIVQEEYDNDLIRVTALVTPKLAGQMRKLLTASAVQAERPS